MWIVISLEAVQWIEYIIIGYRLPDDLCLSPTSSVDDMVDCTILAIASTTQIVLALLQSMQFTFDLE